ncbi:MAG: hypothetical protein FJ320_01210 [SAR202 cluster bacterium]|nr:hypothetical protein [SAR202 cluster bacterium]
MITPIGPESDPSREYTASKEMRHREEAQAKEGRPWERKPSALRRMTLKDAMFIAGLIVAWVVVLSLILSLLG